MPRVIEGEFYAWDDYETGGYRIVVSRALCPRQNGRCRGCGLLASMEILTPRLYRDTLRDDCHLSLPVRVLCGEDDAP